MKHKITFKINFRLMTAVVACLFYAPVLFSQCLGIIDTVGPQPNPAAAAASCPALFSGSAARYQALANYIPDTLDPVITVKLVLHVFTPSTPIAGAFNTSNDPWNGKPGLQTLIDGYGGPGPTGAGFQDQDDRFSTQRVWHATSNPNFNPTYIQDSKLRYEVVAVYYYTSDNLYYGTANGLPSDGNQWLNPPTNTIPNPGYNPRITGAGDAVAYVNTNYPDRLGEGIPIIMTTECQYQSVMYSTVAGYIPFIAVCHGPGVDLTSQVNNNSFHAAQLRHEIGHAMGLLHTYYASCCPEDLDCSKPDYLSDVFPPSNPDCASLTGNPPTSACGACYEMTLPMWSTNIMSSGWPNTWMSPLQMARRARKMHLDNTRIFAKDMLSGHANPWLVSGGVTETWDFDIKMYKDIVVKAGNTLIIKCKVAMATDGKITVEKGARLVIDGGLVTGWCKSVPAGNNYNVPLWTGVEVAGDPSQNQLINNFTGYCANQGIVEVKNGGTISYALKGINTSLTNSSGGGWISNTSGGIVIATGAVFENNVFDIIFYKYNLGNVRNKIENSSFITTGEIGYDGNANLIAAKEHIKLVENWGLTIKGCQFTYAAGATYANGDRSSGIYTTDSYFTVDELNAATPTVFTGLREGIYIDNGNPVYTATIRNCNFTDNEYGTKVENCNYLLFYNNDLNIPAIGIGVYIFRSKYYNIRNNVFAGTPWTGCMGVIAHESKEGLHQVYRNTFSDLNTGINCQDDNGGYAWSGNGLKMNCNVFNSAGSNLLDISMMAYSQAPVVMTRQSSNTALSADDFVKNLYGAQNIIPGMTNKWYVDPSNTQNIVHSCTPGGADNPNVPFAQAGPQVVVSPYAYYPFVYNTICPDWTTSGGGNPGASLAENILVMNDHITDLRSLDPVESGPEIQATVVSKLHLFLTDTLPESNDSVVAILQNNQGGMDDADIQAIFAQLRNGNYAPADAAINDLPADRADWKGMLEKISEIKQSPDGIDGFFNDPTQAAFIAHYANTEDMDGQACALGLLSYMGTAHDFPVVYAIPSPDGRLAQPTGLIRSQKDLPIKLYPNPAQTGFTIENLPTSQAALKVEVLDVVGKKVITETVSNPNKHYVMLKDLAAGVYLVKVIGDKDEIVYKAKIVKQN